ncbi:hypothetical protein BD324DRAFT_583367 [Kockovaella imperatae]|uniref:Pantoate--beta-alanine ligase n=1 Tax=Kockovaella imperatae TaxID=4999 RepID=A0A1Y1U8K3_9TREE|nr:hypothetical protein BD324DRAFT_583367 [Kockovaella imperatae]ORX34342.1 hypothetical protein BD324DRAFT_583367 [Kockovaella imperatae]
MKTPIPVIKTLSELRHWRQAARMANNDVAIVPTMGALHQGHLDLVRHALNRHALTVMTLFVNPMQFAPTEDLSKYPRTLEQDLALLAEVVTKHASTRSTITGTQLTSTDAPFRAAAYEIASAQSPLIVFNPHQYEMYPLRGELQDMNKHSGLRIEMRGIGNVLEGQSRPQFFTGVATVCTKLFNAVEPDHAYFGQKDIQQALLLKLMVTDLLLAHPKPSNLHILPTTRDPTSSLALSSRNAYLSPEELKVAPVLYKALTASHTLWKEKGAIVTGEQLVECSKSIISEEMAAVAASGQAVTLRLDYIELFDRDTFTIIRGPVQDWKTMVLAGAVFVGNTRLIDNVLLGWTVD